MDVDELRPGLWRWTAPHPEWTPDEGGPGGWERDVGCLYVEAPDAVVLVDPLVPSEPEVRRFWSALDRDVGRLGVPVAALLTTFWHERSTREVADRYGGEVWAHDASVPRLEHRPDRTFREGDALPGGAAAFATLRRDEVAFWFPAYGALAVGDVLLGAGAGELRVCPTSWLGPTEPDAFRADLRRLLDLPIELVLPGHGPAVASGGRAALERALAAPPWGGP